MEFSLYTRYLCKQIGTYLCKHNSYATPPFQGSPPSIPLFPALQVHTSHVFTFRTLTLHYIHCNCIPAYLTTSRLLYVRSYMHIQVHPYLYVDTKYMHTHTSIWPVPNLHCATTFWTLAAWTLSIWTLLVICLHTLSTGLSVFLLTYLLTHHHQTT